jgi:hypothetical protein
MTNLNYPDMANVFLAADVKTADVNCSSSSADGNELIAAVPGKELCVLGLFVYVGTTATLTLYSGPASEGDARGGPMTFSDPGGYILPVVPDPRLHWFTSDVGKSLVLKLSDSVQASGFVVYREG